MNTFSPRNRAIEDINSSITSLEKLRNVEIDLFNDINNAIVFLETVKKKLELKRMEDCINHINHKR